MICSEFLTCPNCAKHASCSWSLEFQTCIFTSPNLGNLTVNIEGHCPRFLVQKKSVLRDEIYSYTVTVSNDKNNFIKFLQQRKITCNFEQDKLEGLVINNEIKCNVNKLTALRDKRFKSLMIYHYHITFDNDIILRFNSDSDNYFMYYDHECDSPKDEECVTCKWNGYGYKNYYKRCSSNNQCMGLYEYYAKWHMKNYTRVSISDIDQDGGVRLECSEVEIRTVEPVTAPWLGGTMVKFGVINHHIVGEGKDLAVTVAGRECTEPKARSEPVDGVTMITCAMLPVANTDHGRIREGPVRLQYISDSPKITVISALIVDLVDPVITDISPRCGPAAGGTMLRISGRFLDAGKTLRVTVGDYVACEPIVLYPDLIVCRMGKSMVSGPTATRLKVVFDGQMSKDVGDGSVVFTIAAVPALEPGQSPNGIASGGTTVQLVGRHFSCLRHAMLYVRHGERKHYTGCRLVNDTLAVCRSPKLIYGHGGIYGGAASLQFGLRVQDSEYHESDLSSPRDPYSYSLHADPVLVDFVTDGHTVTINGHDLNRGYQPRDDLAVRFRSSSHVCEVTSINSRRIVCVSYSTSETDLAKVGSVVVTIGDTFTYVVKRKVEGGFGSGPQHSVVMGIKFGVLIAIVVACISLYRKKTKRRVTRTMRTNPNSEIGCLTER